MSKCIIRPTLFTTIKKLSPKLYTIVQNCCFSVDLAASCASLPRIFTTVSQLWLSEKPQIMTAATHTLEILLKDALAPACLTVELVQQHMSKIRNCFEVIESGLSYQHHGVWHQILHLIGVMFEVSN